MVTKIRQYYSQQTWTFFTIHDRSTVLSCLYQKILLVVIKTCILHKFSWNIVGLFFSFWKRFIDISSVLTRFNEINQIKWDSWDWTIDLVHSHSSPICFKHWAVVFFVEQAGTVFIWLNGMRLTRNGIFKILFYSFQQDRVVKNSISLMPDVGVIHSWTFA
jgi:hypothetical protein